jgi:hypothetical protein
MGFIESHLVIRARLPHTAGEEKNQPPHHSGADHFSH